jgi:hypothetical protein
MALDGPKWSSSGHAMCKRGMWEIDSRLGSNSGEGRARMDQYSSAPCANGLYCILGSGQECQVLPT